MTDKMKKSPDDLAAALQRLFTAFTAAPKRGYESPEDWENGDTGIKVPVAYALWSNPEDSVPMYVGQTTSLGHRLWTHFKRDWGNPMPTHVSFLDAAELGDPGLLSAFEHFLIAIWEPRFNDLVR